jgi:hypothetical protein
MTKQATSYDLRKYLNLMDLPMGPKSKTYIYDPVNGSDSNTGTNLDAPWKTLEYAEDHCVGDQHDAVICLSGDTANNPAATIAWDKDYTHLVGLSSPLYGLGQRCRVVALAATALEHVIAFSSNGCIIKNMQFNNEKVTGAASGVAKVTGQRNFFENTFFMAPSANDAASYSLKSAGAENVYKRCTIGQTTNARAAASYGLWLHKGAGASVCREKYVDCEFLSWGATADHVHVLVDADIATVPWWIQFEGCLFLNARGGGAALTQAIDDNSTATYHQIIFRGRNNLFVGATVVGDALSYMWAPNPDASISGLLAVVVAES